MMLKMRTEILLVLLRYVQIKDPLNLDFEANGIRATIGTRLNLSIFKIFADYTFQNYNTATVGIAFSVR